MIGVLIIGLSDPEIVSLVVLLGLIAFAVIARYRPANTQPHPGCVTCGVFATHTIHGQPLCEDHARIAHQAGYQGEPIR